MRSKNSEKQSNEEIFFSVKLINENEIVRYELTFFFYNKNSAASQKKEFLIQFLLFRNNAFEKF